MKREKLETFSIETLLARFEVLCIEQYHSLEREEINLYNKRFEQIENIINELKARSGDQRSKLAKFYNHRNSQVALTAAEANLAIDYRSARSVIEEIAEAGGMPQEGSAGMTLQFLDDGIFKPT
jgi:hypothetical protein